MTDFGEVPELRERIIAHFTRTRRGEFWWVGYVALLVVMAVEAHGRGSTLHAGLLIGLAALGAGARITTLRQEASLDAVIARETTSARACMRCGTLVAGFESRCPRCGSMWRRLHRDQWMPLLFLLALVLCVGAAFALAR